ncbi:f-box-like domain-containing protein [Ditylenchus destructor]|uniref:F-box-like domain-containing protein n=1 Tax=Ditylenchus destructor TaxID=166010 RepID=A0AAD4MTE7_9BILA|nr:f-box-like domain-containing protein [Ditylenchus destructor]
MFKRKKCAAGSVKLKSGNSEQKCAISLPHDVLAEVFRYFSRKELCRKIYLVNRQFYDLATCCQYVAAFHVIEFIAFFESTKAPKINSPYNLYLRCTNRKQNYVSLSMPGYVPPSRCYPAEICTFLTRHLKKMPAPSPFIRFRHVYMSRILGESTLQYLHNAKQSFIGSIIFYGICLLENSDIRRQMFYLLQNVFHKPSFVYMYGYAGDFLNLIKQAEDLPNCNNMKLTLLAQTDLQQNATATDRDRNNDVIRILLDWLQSGKNLSPGSEQACVQKKHLTLIHFPISVIVNMIQRIRNDFESSTFPPSEFVVTFIGYIPDMSSLEGEQKFVLDKGIGRGRLSFFKHCHYVRRIDKRDMLRRYHAYRLWSRVAFSEAEDSIVSTFLQNWKNQHTSAEYRDFYAVDYPLGSIGWDSWYGGFEDDVNLRSFNQTLMQNDENDGRIFLLIY